MRRAGERVAGLLEARERLARRAADVEAAADAREVALAPPADVALELVARLPIPVERIAEDLLGLEVRESDALGEASGLLVPRERRVWLAGDEPAPRKRFTLAHEIGHWVCQCREGRAQVADVLCREVDLSTDRVTRVLEREANIFAAELLMPRVAVRAVWEREQDVAAAAARFAVSDVAMGWRLYALGHVEYKPV